ncbi:O-antigen polymerase [uncultured Parabacteroides sp.]|uniref:O-antigen polymerase n=1 Tax=uncultured Parabacteroides sp. TaxID=512312 RepID=UPI00259552B6|nr:O-antigen polymerase [uncultured Parabacteroides sp.]
MIIIIAFLLLLLAGIIYIDFRDILAPAFLSLVVWGFLLFFYGILDHGMYALSERTLYILLLWNVTLCCGALLFSKVNLRHRDEGICSIYINPIIQNVYRIIVFAGTPYLFYIAYKQGMTGDSDFLFNLRMANTGIVKSDYEYGLFEYVIPIAYILLIVELLQYKKGRNKSFLILFLLINFGFGIMAMAKSSFLFKFGGCLLVLMLKSRIAINKILIGVICIVVLMASIQLLRAGDDDTAQVLSKMFYTYIFGGIPALDTIVETDVRSVVPGQLTASFFRNVKNKIGFPASGELEFLNNVFDENNYVYIPTPTNVYTVVSPFYMDFSYCGIICFAFITGAIAGILYRMTRKGQAFGIILYSYIACVLVLQFFAEYIFNNFSYFLQLILWSWILTTRWKCHL